MRKPTPSERAMLATAAAHESWSQTPDRSARTLPARRAFYEGFERQVDPEGILPPAIRAQRAESLRKAFYTRMALKSAQARRRRAGKRP